MKKADLSISSWMVTALVVACVFFVAPGNISAKQELIAIEGVSYNVNISMAENLKTFIGKKISVTTVEGKTLTGAVKAVGDHLVHLEKLEGKEFFDALIPIENISTIEAMFRNYQR